jgi:polar amino acid transport system substrate-binding protein
MKFRTTFLAITLGLYAASLMAQALPERIRKAGKLVVATQPNYPPITYKDPATNQLQGFDIDLGEALGKELGVKIEWQETAFAQIFPSLATGRVDLAMAGVGDFPSRRETVDFVNYMRTGAQFYTSTANANTIKTMEDVCGKKVGASRSTKWPEQIEEWSKINCIAKGRTAIQVIGTEGSADARTQLKSGRLDVGVQGNETMPYAQRLEPNTFVVIGTPFTDALVGMPVAKTESALRDVIRGALDSLQRKGIYEQLLTKHGLQANKWAASVNQGK